MSEADGVIWLWIARTDDEIAAAYPDTTGMTAALHRVGIGRAAAALAMTGAQVRVTITGSDDDNDGQDTR